MSNQIDIGPMIRKDLDNGYAFVPLIGSGLSVASGIPTSSDFLSYLRYCLALCIDRETDIKEHGWPSFTDCITNDLPLYKGLTALSEKEPKLDVLKEILPIGLNLEWKRKLYLEAVGVSQDWRSMLHLLSRIRKSNQKSSPIVHLSPDYSIIDSFNIHITRGRTPNLAHKMIAHLARPMRMRLILTTNFDTLLEDAFQMLGNPLAVYDVHKDSGLPASELVKAQPALVKLHGGRYGTRADFSLDEEPSEPDKQAFLEYLSESTRLIVAGYSGKDRRIMALIKYALQTLKTKLIIYWVCHTETVRKELNNNKYIHKYIDQIQRPVANAHFLFLELYQQLTHSLPPGGTEFPLHGHIAPQAHTLNDEGNEMIERLKKAIQSNIYGPDKSIWSINFNKKYKDKVIVVQAGYGVSSPLAKIYEEFSKEKYCIWFELDDFCRVRDLLEALVKCMARRRGIHDSEIVSPLPDKMKVNAIKQYIEKISISPFGKEWFIVFYGRGGAGNDSGWECKSWNKNEYQRFRHLLKALAILHIQIIYLPFDKQRERCFKNNNYLGKHYSVPTPDPFIGRGPYPFKACYIDPKYRTALNKALKWTRKRRNDTRYDNPKTRRRFLFAMSLFRESRHPSALCTWALIKPPKSFNIQNIDNDLNRAKQRKHWLTELRKIGIIRGKPDGFTWMHWDVREGIKKKLINKYKKELHAIEAECHQGIADWYLKAFRATLDPGAFFESFYHRYRCIQTAINASFSSTAVKNLKIPIKELRIHLVRGTFLEMITSIERAKPALLRKANRDLARIMLNPPDTIADDKYVNKLIPSYITKKEMYKSELHGLETHFHHLSQTLLRRMEEQEGRYKFNNNSQNHDLNNWGRFLSIEPTPIDWVVQYSQVVKAICRREYKNGMKLINELFKKLEFLYSSKITEIGVVDSLEQSEPKAMRAIAVSWLCRTDIKATEIRLRVRILRRYMYLKVLDAILTELYRKTKKGRAKWAQAEGIYTMVTELLRYTQDIPGMFGSVENVRVRSEYALVLAHLNRFSEAHRRLDEARGYLAMIPGQSNSALLAEIKVRRAEVNLLKAIHIQKQRGKQLQALILDCFDSIEQAENIMITYGKATWWRSKLSVIKLQAFAYLVKLNKKEQKDLPKILIDSLDRWIDTYKLGIQLAAEDPLRKLYLCEYGLQILNRKKIIVSQNDYISLRTQMLSILKNISSRNIIDERLKIYAEYIYNQNSK